MPEGSYQFQVGSIRCTVFSDGYQAYPPGWFFPNADAAELTAALERRRLPLDHILSPFTCLLIESDRHIALVDTGAGKTSNHSGALLSRLEMAGLRPRDVDSVVLTHAHPDHIGGTLDLRRRPVFPEAVHYVSEVEGDFWMAPRREVDSLRLPADVKRAMQDTARHSLRQLGNQVERIHGETEIIPGVHAIPAPGHTPGHLALRVASGGEQLLHLGDAAVHPLHLERPEWENGFDQDAGQATRTRQELLDRAAAGDMHIMAFHFPFPSVGRATAHRAAWRWIPGW